MTTVTRGQSILGLSDPGGGGGGSLVGGSLKPTTLEVRRKCSTDGARCINILFQSWYGLLIYGIMSMSLYVCLCIIKTNSTTLSQPPPASLSCI